MLKNLISCTLILLMSVMTTIASAQQKSYILLNGHTFSAKNSEIWFLSIQGMYA